MAFEQSIVSDLRRLRADVDRLARSNVVGHSSLKPGEGCIDVYDASDRLVAQVGDTQAGYGVAVPDPDRAGSLVLVGVLIERRRAELKQLLKNEHEARISAVQSEASTRAAQDKNLSGRITNETAARQSADSSLGTRITNESNARQSAISSLNTRIGNETKARQSAVNSIQSQLNNHNRRLKALEKK